MIHSLGLRIERLLYFGFFLISLCWIEFYFVQVTLYFENANNQFINLIIKNIVNEKPNLEEAFQEKNKPLIPQTDDKKRTAELRAKLGLPKEKIDSAIPAEKSYESKLLEILNETYQESGFNKSVLKRSLDTTKSPDELVNELQTELKSIESTYASVMGVQMPKQISFQYGTNDLTVPSQFIANILLVIAQTLAMIWIGSFHITRQRELVAIRGCDDYKAPFPHILSWFATLHISLNEKLGETLTKKALERSKKFYKFITALFRCMIILAIDFLILFPLLYSTIMLTMPEIIQYPVYIIMTVNIILALILLLNEIVIMQGKVFYA